MLVTALVTPFVDEGRRVDLRALERLVAFQRDQGVDVVLLFGTTGEGASLTDDERDAMFDAALSVAPPEALMVGLGFGPLASVIERGRRALRRGVRDMLLVDHPYAGPSSASLRQAWHGPIAAALPEARLFPYAVPGRTGTELLPDDLAKLVENHPNVVGCKDATGRLARMERVRELLGDDFLLMCGDDAHLRDAMIDPDIRAQGGFSVVSNLAPGAVARLVASCRAGDAAGARRLHDELLPLFRLVGITADETVTVGGREHSVPQRVRNPVPLKEVLQRLGVLAELCRAPLAPMGPAGRRHAQRAVLDAVARAPELLSPLELAFGVDVRRRLGEAREEIGAA
ncbi:MAG: dihydrodipicolinate synthase family protein [Planctomycetes bacterium]|nr:dihydrodipicolinate synthase family protein [Planctomycetota bacterium]